MCAVIVDIWEGLREIGDLGKINCGLAKARVDSAETGRYSGKNGLNLEYHSTSSANDGRFEGNKKAFIVNKGNSGEIILLNVVIVVKLMRELGKT